MANSLILKGKKRAHELCSNDRRVRSFQNFYSDMQLCDFIQWC